MHVKDKATIETPKMERMKRAAGRTCYLKHIGQWGEIMSYNSEYDVYEVYLDVAYLGRHIWDVAPQDVLRTCDGGVT